MNPDAARQLAVDLAEKVVERMAPDELPGFDTQAEAWFEDPERARRGDWTRSDPLGLGLEAELLNNTPLALFVVQHVVSAGTSILFAAAGRKAGRRLFKKRRDHAAETAENIAEPFDGSALVKAYRDDFSRIRELALDAAKEFGADPTQAELVAEILVAVLKERHREQPPEVSA